MEPPWLIATALPEELGALLRRVHGARRRDGAFDGLLGGRSVRLACTGAGPAPGAHGLERLLAHGPFSLVIGAGVAGALTPQLGIADVIVGQRVRDGRGDTPASDEAWLGRAMRLGARPAVAFSVDHVVTRPAERLALVRELPADVAASVDMESASWTRVAQRRGLPCLLLRAISDGATDALPDDLFECLDADGSIRRSWVLARALARPRSWPALLRLRRQTREAAESLAHFIEALSIEEA